MNKPGSKHTLNMRLTLRDKVLDLSEPRIMGVLNVTPDSFSDGGQFNDLDRALGHIGLMIGQGADIIDVGGESTRPGSDPVTEETELARVVPVLERAIPEFPDTLFSIDTTKHRVARKALQLGVHLVNDISGLQKEPRLADLCAEYEAGCILMHSQGNPKTMQQNPEYGDILEDIREFFEKKSALARAKGVKSIILDPGIGFGKTLEHNLKILANLNYFMEAGYPLMIGVSRKSMLGNILGDRPVDDRLIGTVAAHYDTLVQGVRIIRVHDVKEARDSVRVYTALEQHRK